MHERVTDTALCIMAAAVRRPDGAVLPVPDGLEGDTAKALESLRRRGWIVKGSDARGATAYSVTRQGCEGIALDPSDFPELPDLAQPALV